MPKAPNPDSAEAKALVAAMREKGVTNVALAQAIGADKGFVSHWVNDVRPVPWEWAEPVAKQLGLQPEAISPEFRKIKEKFLPSQPERRTSPKLHNAATAFLAKFAGTDSAITPELLIEASKVLDEQRAGSQSSEESEGKIHAIDTRRSRRTGANSKRKNGVGKKDEAKASPDSPPDAKAS